ncbi:MAG: S41 family peptidase [Candidatus Magasanikbacteria bacterium]
MIFQDNKPLKIAALVLLLLVGVYLGFQVGVERGKQIEKSEDLPVSKNSALQENFSMFWEAVEIIKDNYYKPKKINDKKLLYGSIEGVVNSLGDPYSSFLNPSDAQKFSEDMSGTFGGIGAKMGVKEGQLVIVSPLKGNPAEKEGLKSGDKILKVNDKLTNDLSIKEAVKLIRGKVGTKVDLMIMRDEFKKPKKFTITRGKIEIPTLDWKMKEGNIAYMQLYSFNAKAASRFSEASFQALLDGAQGIILDLRNNSGGFLKVAQDIAGWFLEKGEVVVKERFPSGRVKKFRAQGNGAWGKFPIVVLVNEGSASASEIVAGALRDRAEATLVGENTFGKGTVQEVKSLSNGAKIKVSVAEWVLPDGDTIHKKGLKPGVTVQLDKNIEKGEEDPQLQEALRIIRRKAQMQNIKQNKVLPFSETLNL